MKSKIVTHKDINFLVAEGLKIFTPDMLSLMKQLGVSPEITIRLSFLSAKCSETRAKLGWDLPTAARKIGVPRYRIAAIESGQHTGFSQKEVRLYVKALGIDEWFERWRKANRQMFLTIAKVPDGSTPWAKKVRGTGA
ncbi:MAG: hypothetical protein HYR76_10945 [Ignavibacteria bacterium]|nr:hypothetical protein [Ignavibacteria bacterium]